MTGEETNTNRWDASDYDGDHAFVYEYGRDLLALLDPKPGERILDLGCGTGHLTAEIADAVGADGDVVGIDQADEMVADARESYPDLTFREADARSFTADEPFDAVFSNASLHWIPDVDQDEVLATVTDALRPGGRFVAEMGGSGNVKRITEAALAALREHGYDRDHPWYFPSVGTYASRLEDHGFEVRAARLFDRPTELEGADGLRNWLAMFGDSLLAGLDERERETVIAAVENHLREDLYEPETTTWTADYRRLRFLAFLARASVSE